MAHHFGWSGYGHVAKAGDVSAIRSRCWCSARS